ncbi:hypothetical protein CRG98_043132 [Punica granatum]|uniref:Uncharacterized protein n=1 Tax=Punica granatum TaxID=22663 RepID=A0A2I0HYY9_PUNGR|nr:hypothetical protein CRG98_043132 [Punica granatum]
MAFLSVTFSTSPPSDLWWRWCLKVFRRSRRPSSSFFPPSAGFMCWRSPSPVVMLSPSQVKSRAVSGCVHGGSDKPVKVAVALQPNWSRLALLGQIDSPNLLCPIMFPVAVVMA